jgi:protoporphyrinogen IX oxidase
MAYLWIKVLHVLAIISWMAGLLYLPRLFVYHADVDKGSATSELFKVMERRLLRYIMTPAMIVAWATGLYLAVDQGYFSQGWFHLKLLMVLLMSASHGVMSRHVRLFASDLNEKNQKYFRVFNEIPTILMIVIVIAVIIRPF